MILDNLTEGERFIVEWQFGMLGGFKTSLVECIANADIANKTRLAMGFPVEVQAYINFNEVNGWWESVQEKAETGP